MSRTAGGADGLDQRLVGVVLTVLALLQPFEKHRIPAAIKQAGRDYIDLRADHPHGRPCQLCFAHENSQKSLMTPELGLDHLADT